MKTMFPREFVQWLVNNLWYDSLMNEYGIIGGNGKYYTLEEIYQYWRLEIEPKTKEDENRNKKPTLEEIQKWFKVNVSLLTIGEDDQGNDVLMKEDDRLMNEICSLNNKAMQEYADLFHKEKLREELIAYDEWYYSQTTFTVTDGPNEKLIDLYLKTKE